MSRLGYRLKKELIFSIGAVDKGNLGLKEFLQPGQGFFNAELQACIRAVWCVVWTSIYNVSSINSQFRLTRLE